MSNPSIVIYGETIFCLSLNALLTEQLAPHANQLISCVATIRQLLALPTVPKVIFAERNGRDDIYHLPPSHQHVPILTLDMHTNNLQITNHQTYVLDTLVDLVKVILMFNNNTKLVNPAHK